MIRLSLRWRVTLAFGLTCLLVTGVLGAVTVRLASQYMLDQRLESVRSQAAVNVQLLRAVQGNGSENVDELLDGFAADPGSSVLVGAPGAWALGGRTVDPAELPDDVVTDALDGATVDRRVTVGGVPALLVAAPVTSGRTVFLQLFPLSEYTRITRFLTLVLSCGVLAAGLVGAAAGRWASRRALRPLTRLTVAAGRVAAGDLHARLPEQTDPDLAELGRTFNATAAALEQRVARDSRFAADVSHELRSPLTTMANAVALLRRRRDRLPGTAAQAVDLLDAEVQRFQQVVLDLLEISTADQTLDATSFEDVDLAVLVGTVTAAAGLPPPEVSGPTLVRGDRRRLQRVVGNLLDNAALHGGGVRGVEVRGDAGRVRLTVADGGSGVPDAAKEQNFERFSRGGGAGQRDGGTGLGLALVAQHVGAHGGRVWVEDRPGGGACFVVELPATR